MSGKITDYRYKVGGKILDYQSFETAWRYEYYRSDAARRALEVDAVLRKAQAELQWLSEHPPLYEYFNWSA